MENELILIFPLCFSGGLSNLLYLCSLPPEVSPLGSEPDCVLLRLYGQVRGETEEALAGLLTEAVIFTLLSENQRGPRLLGVFPGGRLEEFIPVNIPLTWNCPNCNFWFVRRDPCWPGSCRIQDWVVWLPPNWPKSTRWTCPSTSTPAGCGTPWLAGSTTCWKWDRAAAKWPNLLRQPCSQSSSAMTWKRKWCGSSKFTWHCPSICKNPIRDADAIHKILRGLKGKQLHAATGFYIFLWVKKPLRLDIVQLFYLQKAFKNNPIQKNDLYTFVCFGNILILCLPMLNQFKQNWGVPYCAC